MPVVVRIWHWGYVYAGHRCPSDLELWSHLLEGLALFHRDLISVRVRVRLRVTLKRRLRLRLRLGLRLRLRLRVIGKTRGCSYS